MHLDWRYVMPEGASDGPAIRTSLTEAEAARLASLARGTRVLEVGSAYGFSAITMALGGALHVTSVDPHSWCQPPTLPIMQFNLTEHGVEDRVELRQETFFTAAPELPEDHYGLIFLDGDHSYETVKFDFVNAKRLLHSGGVIACHDYLECCCPGVKQALDELVPLGPYAITDTTALYSASCL
jgi:predicted O-methyltransferase YrrM